MKDADFAHDEINENAICLVQNSVDVNKAIFLEILAEVYSG
jgi:hypothetical protein